MQAPPILADILKCILRNTYFLWLLLHRYITYNDSNKIDEGNTNEIGSDNHNASFIYGDNHYTLDVSNKRGDKVSVDRTREIGKKNDSIIEVNNIISDVNNITNQFENNSLTTNYYSQGDKTTDNEIKHNNDNNDYSDEHVNINALLEEVKADNYDQGLSVNEKTKISVNMLE